MNTAMQCLKLNTETEFSRGSDGYILVVRSQDDIEGC